MTNKGMNTHNTFLAHNN